MIERQRGVTAIGWMIILAILAFFVLVTLRLFPLFNEKFTVEAAMKSVAHRNGIEQMSEHDILKNFERTVQVGGSYQFDDQSTLEKVHIEKSKDKKTRFIHVTYQQTNKFFDDVQFLLVFDKSMELKSGGSGE